jgi:adenylate cyclase
VDAQQPSAAMRLPRLPPTVRRILGFIAVGAVLGGAWGHMMAMADGLPLFCPAGVPRGVVTGVIITGILFSFELCLVQPATARWRRLPFLVHLAARTAIDLVIILFGLVVGARLLPSPAEVGVALPVERGDVLFAFAAVLAIRFVDDVNHLLGQNVLLDFVTGRYHRPRLEQRVFLFIDIEGSTALAERLGALAFHRLVSRFVADVTDAIAAARGEIHRYVGDELIATWKLADGIAEGRCVRACFAALGRLAELAPAYRREFGAAVACRAGLHCGPVVAGEMGTLKREIAFLGDTVNTAARIEEFCRQSGHRVLASADLVDRVELPPGIAKRPLGALHLRGKESDVALYALEELPDRGTAIAA